MATKILQYGDYQGILPDGWQVLEVPPGMKLVKEGEALEMVKQLDDAKEVINQTATVFAGVNKLDPNIFNSGSINWGALVFKLQKASSLGPEFEKLNRLVQKYSKTYNIEVI